MNNRRYPNNKYPNNPSSTPGRGRPRNLANGGNDSYTNSDSVTAIRGIHTDTKDRIDGYRHDHLDIRGGREVGAIGRPDKLPQNQATQNQGGFATAPNISSALPQNHINPIKTKATAKQGDQNESWVNKIMRRPKQNPNTPVR